MNPPYNNKTIHHHFADFICSTYNCHDEVLKAIIFCVSYMTSIGHNCLSLVTIAQKQLRQIIYDDTIDVDDVKFPDAKTLEKYVLQSDAFAKVPDQPKPLVYLDGNCYLYRYYNYENIILQYFQNASNQNIDHTHISKLLNAIDVLQSKEMKFSSEQILAQLTALLYKLCVISGGPGTGKTTVIAAIVYQMLRNNPNCTIALCAPTGKAASRLMQAIVNFKEKYVEKNLTEYFPQESFTIHRLLGSQKGQLEFYYNQDNRLPYDVVIVDECSMVDIPLMAKLCKALKDDAGLILVGDKDQLSSVEIGAFFGDVCYGASVYAYTDNGSKLLQSCNCTIDKTKTQKHPLRDAIVILNTTFRFDAESGIATLATAIRTNDERKAIEVLGNKFEDVEFKEYDSMDWLYAEIQNYANTWYRTIVDQLDIHKAFARISDLCILSPFKSGPWGVETYNVVIESQLRPSVIDEWYHGRVIMVTANDYNLEIFNGDTGIYIGNDGAVYFQSANGFRKINTSLLSNYVPAYSITVHKSQGSEFSHVVLILPHIDIGNNEHWKMLLTRELLYTAVTRARSKLTILGNRTIVEYMIKNPTMRTSGLRQQLWKR